MQTQRDIVLDLLESTVVTTPTGPKSGLQVLVSAWLENCEAFQGFWTTRISDLGLCQMFLSERPSLAALGVKGDLIIRPETRDIIVTRSRAKQMPIEYTTIPFPAKVIKIILGGLTVDAEPAAPGLKLGSTSTTSGDDDDDDEEWADEETVYQGKGIQDDDFGFISDLLEEDEFPDDREDEDLKEDPVSKIDMQAHLFAFLTECVARNINNFSRIVDDLNVEEQMTLQRALQG